jgi:hypothetical protein
VAKFRFSRRAEADLLSIGEYTLRKWGETQAADIRRTRHIGDFRKWKDHDSFQKSLDRLLRDLKSQGTKPK